MTVFVGVDPGLCGAIAILREDGLEVVDMPVERVSGSARVKERVNAAMLYAIMKNASRIGASSAVIEHVAAMPKQGVSSVFSLGDSFGVVRACAFAAGFRCSFVSPVVWKRAFSLLGSDKDASRTRASEIFPTMCALWNLKRHHGRAEAALLAEYARRTC